MKLYIVLGKCYVHVRHQGRDLHPRSLFYFNAGRNLQNVWRSPRNTAKSYCENFFRVLEWYGVRNAFEENQKLILQYANVIRNYAEVHGWFFHPRCVLNTNSSCIDTSLNRTAPLITCGHRPSRSLKVFPKFPRLSSFQGQVIKRLIGIGNLIKYAESVIAHVQHPKELCCAGGSCRSLHCCDVSVIIPSHNMIGRRTR